VSWPAVVPPLAGDLERPTVNRRTEAGHRTLWGLVACGLLLLAVGCARADPPAPEQATPTPEVTIIPPPATKLVPVLPRRPERAEAPVPQGTPRRVVIEAIGVDAELVELGLQPDGAMEVPGFGWAGWYAEGPPPGHPGPAVIAAHVDSRSGPDVFYRLRELVPDDEVVVRYDGGDEVVFRVVASERVSKDELPGDRIWPVTADRLLTLITCGGEFDRSVRHYRDNVIVFTSPADG
jgi:hypothetical protein